MPVAVALVATAAYGAYENRKAGKRAKSAISKSEAANQAAQAQAREDFAPYQQLGQQGASGLQALASGDYSGFMNSPDYLATQQSGLQALDRSAAARGALNSGGADADRIAFGSNLGAQYLGQYRGFLGNLAQMGQNAVGSLTNVGQATAGNTAANAQAGAAAANQVGANNVQLFGNLVGGLTGGMSGGGGGYLNALGMGNTRTSAYSPASPWGAAASNPGSIYNFGNNVPIGGGW